ncbi:zinc-dependent metalloprotease family protein [Metapseudomonas otitidis]|uniref:zinc-dependent metalloprotease family protein n=1 Tax=Metapseudomonas otitidis TaxID=319939 RepID=UPI0025421F9A|nr:zinc-dependent metalloprotease family protein [Pseudomonas otitidis]WIF70139.1 zinc-dependent metalloprotease family protein [Pseudomonas otitidis]
MKKLLACLAVILLAPFAQAATEPRTVDLLVLYTKDAQALPNGRDMNARIASYIEYANNAFKKSNVNLRLRLVNAQPLTWASYPSISSKDLAAFAADPRVQQLRETYGADVVQLISRTQVGQGYGVCGIGYVLSGPKNSGTFQSGSWASAYGITGVDCSLSTMAHEIGHNLGLRHSYEQDQTEGYYTYLARGIHQGTYEWGRGYGVQGRYSTIMAYPQVFNATAQAPLFSTPAVVDSTCANQACGRAGFADAARALNDMAAQIATLRPTKVPETVNPTSTPTTPATPATPTKPVTPTTPAPPVTPAWCSKPVLSSLVANGEFRTLDGWRALLNLAKLSTLNVGKTCRDDALQFELPAGRDDVLATSVGALKVGASYRLKAKVMLKGTNVRGNVYLGMLHEENAGISYSTANGVIKSVTSSEFTPIDVTFVYQPPASVIRNTYLGLVSVNRLGVLLDEVELREVTPAKPVTPTTPAAFGWNFDSAIGEWTGFYGSTRLTALAATGKSLEVHARRADGTGASLLLAGKVQPGLSYRFAADVMVSRTASVAALAYAYLYLEDTAGNGRLLSLGVVNTKGGAWGKLQQSFQVPAGTYRRMELMVLSTRSDQSLYLDNVTLNRL